MQISEIYSSLQGEGLLTATPSVFVRTSGCNLRCDFCDTPFTSWNPAGEKKSLQQILDKIQSVAGSAKHVVITGGEPMLPREIKELCEKTADAGFHITIETAGTIFEDLACDLMSISPKLSNSDPTVSRAGDWAKKHRGSRHRPEIVQQLIERYEHQLKFVVDNESDLEEIQSYLDSLTVPDISNVLLMPQGIEQHALEAKAKWLKPLAAELGFTFCPRKHIEWYGNKRGT